jgi:hypothetical protein
MRPQARRRSAESTKMSNRNIALLVLAVVVAAAVTVEVTYFVIDRFVSMIRTIHLPKRADALISATV